MEGKRGRGRLRRSSGGIWGTWDGCRRPGTCRWFVWQANVEHLTDKMKTDIQRGLVLR